MLGELVQQLLGERSNDDRVEVAGQDVGNVPDRLAVPEPDLGAGQVDGMAAELLDRELEGNSRPQRRLLEQQAETAAGEERFVDVALALVLQAVGEVEDGEQLLAAPVGNPQKIAAFERFHAAMLDESVT